MKVSPYTIKPITSYLPIFHALRATGLSPFTASLGSSKAASCYSLLIIIALIANELGNYYAIYLTLGDGLRFYTVLPGGLYHTATTISCIMSIKASLYLGPTLHRVMESLNRIDEALFRPDANRYQSITKLTWIQIGGACGVVIVDIVISIAAKQFVSPFKDVQLYSVRYPNLIGNALMSAVSMFVVVQYVDIVLIVKTRYDAINRHLGLLLEDADIPVKPDLLPEGKIPREDLVRFDMTTKKGRKEMVATVKWTHCALGEICVDINTVLGKGAFAVAARILLSFVAGLYNLSVFLKMRTSPLSMQLIFSEVFRLVVDMASLIAMAQSGERVMTAAKGTALATQQCLFVGEVEGMQEFVDQMAVERIDFSASLLKVDMQMMMRMVATVSTYAVVWFSLPSPTD